MNAGLLLIIALGCAALLWFVWLGYSDHRKLRQLFGADRARQTPVRDTSDSASPSRRTNP